MNMSIEDSTSTLQPLQPSQKISNLLSEISCLKNQPSQNLLEFLSKLNCQNSQNSQYTFVEQSTNKESELMGL